MNVRIRGIYTTALTRRFLAADHDVVAAADCIIDMGPDGGPDGGRVVARGSPEEVAESRESQTAMYLRQYLERLKAGKSGKHGE